jgi:hypothetical protein
MDEFGCLKFAVRGRNFLHKTQKSHVPVGHEKEICEK